MENEISAVVKMLENTAMEARGALVKEKHIDPDSVIMAAYGTLATDFLKELKDNGHGNYNSFHDTTMRRLIKMEYGVDAPLPREEE